MDLAIFKYFRIFKKYLGIKIYLIFLISTIKGFTDSLGIALIIPLFRALDTDNDLTDDKGLFIKAFENLFNIFNFEITPINLIFTVAFIFFIKSTANFFIDAITSYYEAVLCKKIRVQLCKNSFQMSYQYYLEQDSGYFNNIFTLQTSRTGKTLRSLITFTTKLLDFFIYIIISFFISPYAAFILFIIAILVFFIFKTLNKRIKKISKKFVIQSSILSNRIIELIQSLKYFKATAQVNKIYIPILQKINSIAKGEIESGLYLSLTNSIREFIPVFIVLLVVTIQYFFIKQSITPILVSIALIYRAINAILSCQIAWQSVLKIGGSLDAITIENKMQKSNKEENGKLIIKELKSSIKLKNINFSYKNDKKLVLKNINLEIPANSSIAIVGESGSGKSTILNLILGLYNPTKGEILIDNFPLTKTDRNSWRSMLGYISQETILFNDNIAANISLIFDCKNPSNDTLKKLQEAAAAANINDLIESMPKGYDTFIGENGLKLSGGQRQRLFIARELFRKTKILIFDEATSALDYNSEKVIKNSLNNLKGKVTTVIVTHRLSTLKDVDKIFVMKDGTIIENGTYIDLMKNKDSYFNYLNK